MYIESMIISFADKRTEHLFHGEDSKETRKIDSILKRKICMKLDMINAAAVLEDLRVPPGNKLEALSGDLLGYHSIRVDKQWRIVFRWENGSVSSVQFMDYH
jgi:proteic killer suppression protein